MSSLLFPTLPGMQLERSRAPEWYTGVQTALSGKTSTVAKRRYALIHWEVSFDLLRDTITPSEYLQLLGHFNQVQGRFDSWLYSDPDFNTVSSQLVGNISSGVTQYQLIATDQNSGGPGQAELVQNVNGTPQLLDNGTTISSGNYSIGPTGVVTFSTLPTVGDALTWSGSFYYRCRFDTDTLPGLKKFMNGWWSMDRLAFTSVKL